MSPYGQALGVASLISLLTLSMACSDSTSSRDAAVGGRDASADTAADSSADAEAIISSPVLHFSDITSGPATGNTDGAGGLAASQHGSIVTVWGARLGSVQGTSRVIFEDASGIEHDAAHVYYWVNADGATGGGPANLFKYHKMQEVAFSLPRVAAEGQGQLYLEVAGQRSNALAFTVRAGAIRFVRATGGSSGGDDQSGTWDAPWRTLNAAPGNMKTGDIVYVTSATTALSIRHIQHEALRPGSLVAYPGAEVTIEGGIDFWNRAPYPEYWNVSKFRVTTEGRGVGAMKGMRVVGLSITGPQAAGQSGAISGAGDGTSGVKCFGNHIHDFGLNDASIRLHHVFYLSNRDGTPNDSYELGWNLLEGNHARGGLHIYDEGTCGDFTGPMLIHDNVVVDQSGPCFGIAAGSDPCFSMPVEVYNNLFINCGLDPFPSAAISALKPGAKVHLRLFNNTVYGYGVAGGDQEAVYVQAGGDPDWAFGGTWELINSVVVDTQGLPFFDPQYASTPDIAEGNLYFSTSLSNGGEKPAQDPTALLADPKLRSPATGDYAPASDSPCVDSGSISADALFSSDQRGTPRPQGKGYDIGAIELTTNGQ